MVQWKRIQLGSMRLWARSLASLIGLRVPSCGVGHRLSSDSALLLLWYRLAAVSPIQPLAWELPYAANAALKSKKKKKKEKEIRPLEVL